MRNVKRYLTVASIDDKGVLVVRKPDPLLHQRLLTIVPKDILPGILLALHLQFTHCCESQLRKVFNRYFYGIGSDNQIKLVVDNCHHCVSLRKVPKEMFQQSSSCSPTSIGQLFAADVIKRKSQAIFALQDIHSSFTTAAIIPDETGSTLRDALLTSSAFLRAPECGIRVDNAPGFVTLKDDSLLSSRGIMLDFGRVKNSNKNPSADKCIQELELELLKVDNSGAPVTNATLQTAVELLNSRIRNRGLSAKEIVTCRDQVTHQLLSLDDGVLSQQQEKLRERNHSASAKSKAPHAPPAAVPDISAGSLVYIKSDGDKFNPRDLYMVVSLEEGVATVQKLHGDSFMSKRYTLSADRLFPMTANKPPVSLEDDSSSEDEVTFTLPADASAPSEDSDDESSGSFNNDDVSNPQDPLLPPAAHQHSPRARRDRRAPEKFGDWVSEWDSEEG